MTVDVSFYTNENDEKPAELFIKELEPKMQARMYKLVDMLEENGQDLREPYSKHLNDGIFELRARVGSDISRVLYFFMIGKKAILTNGFIKKTNKTPPSEIDRAKRYRSDYLSRLKKEESENE
jgi:phage-related protein